ncbi:uncharacterized protein LOC126985202 isoform X2 [Eriocheir sinensis]|nr:uncharacterized protein LOC126985202 isoform X2 [Eriocheir sinensis]XP_050695718.1 uncharacterized protein LOC126985202 isoform X2 [Eriocheir sinensis]
MLFTTDAGEPMKFVIDGVELLMELQELIKLHGGQVVLEPGPDTIILVDEGREHPRLTAQGLLAFRSASIYDCIRMRSLLFLDAHRAGSPQASPSATRGGAEGAAASPRGEPSPASPQPGPSGYLEGNHSPRRSGKSSPYTTEEDLVILNYILKTGCEGITGTVYWKDMHKAVKIRSWQALRERFFKRISPNLSKYEYVKDGIPAEKLKKIGKLVQPEKSPRKQRVNFTEREDKIILSYIARHERYAEVTGKRLWDDMHKDCEGLQNHPSHSLRNRYFKSILPRIEKYGLLVEVLAEFKK